MTRYRIVRKSISISLALCLTTFVAGCSDPKLTPSELSKLEICLSSTNWYSDLLKSHGYDKIDPSTKDKYELIKKDELYLVSIALEETGEYVNRVKKSGKKEKFSWHLNADEKGCPLKTVDGIIKPKFAKLDSERQEQNIDAMNKEIDAAQNSLIAEYRQKAVRHSSTSGSGVKVESFTMKNGSTVFCKTSITSAGQAVDCR